MSNRPEAQDYKITTTCQIDAEIKEGLLKHLDDHGAVFLLTSAKFGQYAGCFPEEITRAIAAESALTATAAVDDSSETQDKTAPAPDGTTESPMAVGFRRVSKRVAVSY